MVTVSFRLFEFLMNFYAAKGENNNSRFLKSKKRQPRKTIIRYQKPDGVKVRCSLWRIGNRIFETLEREKEKSHFRPPPTLPFY